MNFLNGLSFSSKEMLIFSKTISMRLEQDFVGTEHVVMAMSIMNGLAGEHLCEAGITLDYLSKELFNREDILEPVTTLESSSHLFEVTMNVSIGELLADMLSEKAPKKEKLYPEEVLVELLTREDSNLCKVIAKKCGDLKKYRSSLIEKMKNREVDFKKSSPNVQVNRGKNNKTSKKRAEPSLKTLNEYGVDLVRLAKENKLSKIIGREQEIDNVIKSLCRKTKNNPCIVGEAGVGKTALVEGLAHRIANGTVPAKLKNASIYSINIGFLLAGAKYRGEFEDRVKSVIKEAEFNDNVILFLDEVHMLVSSGGGENSIDAGNLFKPALSRGAIRCIGATTTKEYKKCIEQDSALERRFQKVFINEPSIDETMSMVYKLRGDYEKHHDVKIDDKAVDACIELSDRYISDRYLPDKAFDLLDESCVNVKMSGKKENIVTKLDVMEVLYSWTGIPVEDLGREQGDKTMAIKTLLSRKVIGQENAVEEVSNAIIRAQAGLRDKSKPIASFIFSGPTGVGKTELAKALSSVMHGSEKNLIRFDMSEYMEKHTVARLIGAPPGYVGHDDGGQLTEVVRNKPHSVILFDEIEKAHESVINIFLQILDDGRLTDGQGRTVDFKNTIVIFTSNLFNPRKDKKKNIGFGGGNDNAKDNREKDLVKAASNKFADKFSPEFVNRLDEIIVFNDLSEDNLIDIFDIMVLGLKKNLNDMGIKITISKAGKAHLINLIENKEYGARPLRRVITKHLENELSKMILQRKAVKGDTIKVSCSKAGLSIAVSKCKPSFCEEEIVFL